MCRSGAFGTGQVCVEQDWQRLAQRCALVCLAGGVHDGLPPRWEVFGGLDHDAAAHMFLGALRGEGAAGKEADRGGALVLVLAVVVDACLGFDPADAAVVWVGYVCPFVGRSAG